MELFPGVFAKSMNGGALPQYMISLQRVSIADMVWLG